MSDRSSSWVGSISDELEDLGPTAFTESRLNSQDQLFSHRGALFYTPTESIPPEDVGSGELDIFIPVAPPDWTDAFEIRAYLSPRLWVDLIQRQTGKIRWKPFCPAKVVFTRHDATLIRGDHIALGTKGLLDALKVKTTGHLDGILRYYFGVIVDDGPSFVDVSWAQELVDHPSRASLVPEKAASDAVQIAVASVHEMNYIVTWNFKHIANPYTRDRLRAVVLDAGFHLPVMCSPEELIQYDEDT